MPFRLDIPGQVNIHQLRAIELVASLAPQNGVIVEVGSLFGRSSWAWGASAPNATVYCMDPWQGNKGVALMERRLGIKYGVEQFIEHTKDLPNIKPMQGFSPQDFKNWELPVDIYYEDAVHVNPILKDNLDFWSSKLKPTGIICGDDYRPRFPDVRGGAERLANMLGRELILVDFFWCLLPSDKVLPGAGRVASALRELGAVAAAESAAEGPTLSVTPFPSLPVVLEGSAPAATFRIVNEGRPLWVAPASGASVAFSILDANRRESARSTVALAMSELGFDLPRDIETILPTKKLRPGRYKLAVDLVDDRGASLLRNRARDFEFSVTSAAKAPSATVSYLLGHEIDFSKDGDADLYKKEGWVAGERAHSWTQGPRSVLILPFETAPGADLRLTLKLKPLVVAGKLDRQRLTLRVNGSTLFEGALNQPTEISVEVAKQIAAARSRLEVELLVPDCARPVDLIEGSADQKYLGVAVSALTLSNA